MDNFHREAPKVIENALNTLERFTDLSDESLDAIREAVHKGRKVELIVKVRDR